MKNALSVTIHTTIYCFLLLSCSHGQQSNNNNLIAPVVEPISNESISNQSKNNKSKNNKSLNHETANAVRDELIQAIENKDFRLYATSGRRVTFPGIVVADLAFVEEVCGKKFMAKTGDVITSKTQKNQRKQTIEYIEVYNQAMIVICRKNH